jgi:hypothetical protein
MDQRLIFMFLAMKGFKAREVHIEVEAVVHEKAVGYSSLTEYLCFMNFDQREPIQEEDPSDLKFGNQAICQALAFQRMADEFVVILVHFDQCFPAL